MIFLVPASIEHACVLVPEMRIHDKFEFENAGVDPTEAVMESVRQSAAAWSALVDGKVACMWGVKEESLVTGGRLWLITTPIVEKHPYRFLVESKRIVDDLIVTYQFLYNYVDAQYETSVRWMQWLGFEVASLSDVGKMRLYRFEKRAD